MQRCRDNEQFCQYLYLRTKPVWPCSSLHLTWGPWTSCSLSWPCSRTRWGPWTWRASGRRSGCRRSRPRGSGTTHFLPDFPSPFYIQIWNKKFNKICIQIAVKGFDYFIFEIFFWKLPVVPPTILKLCQISILSQVQNCDIYDVLHSGAFGCGNSVAFGIKILSHL